MFSVVSVEEKNNIRFNQQDGRNNSSMVQGWSTTENDFEKFVHHVPEIDPKPISFATQKSFTIS